MVFPTLANAACVKEGATVVYINGVFTSLDGARQDLENLQGLYFKATNNRSINFINGYNPSHLAGLGDITQAASQTLNSSISSFDLNTILMQVHPQVTTRKLLLVGHSQGSFYANDIYSYLLEHGSPRAAVGVYHVGSPASFVAGGGKYLTSSNDSIINAARLIASNASDGLIPLAAATTATKPKPVMPANISLSSKDYGHLFSSVYLAEAPERVVGDIHSALSKLKAEAASDTGECFTSPNAGLGYKASKAGYMVADTAASGIKSGIGAAQVAAVTIGNAAALVAQGAYGVAGKVVSDFGITVGGVAGLSKAAEPEKKQTNFDVLKKLYGSSLTKEEYQEFFGDQGSAVALSPVLAEMPKENALIAIKKIIYLSGKSEKKAKPADEEIPPDPEVAPEPEPEPAQQDDITPQVIEEPQPEPVEEAEPETPPIQLQILASQSDNSHLCTDADGFGWILCYSNTDGVFSTDLGTGITGSLDSVTIAKDPESAEINSSHPWLITISCFIDAGYTQPCVDWVAAGPATEGTSAVKQKANWSVDGTFWAANFALEEGRDVILNYPSMSDNSIPVRFDPAHYYRMTINDLGWSTGAYGSLTEPYWVLRGYR